MKGGDKRIMMRFLFDGGKEVVSCIIAGATVSHLELADLTNTRIAIN